MQKGDNAIKKTTSYVTVSEVITYLGIDLTKWMKDLHTGNYKTLLKESKGLGK